MLKATWTAPLTIIMLYSATSFADEAKPSGTDREKLPTATVSVEAILAELELASRWQLSDSIEARAHVDNWPRPIADFKFQESSALARLSQLRSLSLLTLAEVGQTRLFLGVSQDGLLGLHISASNRYGKGRHLEVVRMPYLVENESDSGFASKRHESLTSWVGH